MKGMKKYYGQKILWYLLTLVCAVILNFALPRMMPGNPVSAIAARSLGGNESATTIQKVYDDYAEKFGVNKPMWEQFLIWAKNALRGDFGVSFSQYPRPVSDIIASAVWWTVALMAVVLLWVFGIQLKIAPTSGGYGFDMIPNMSWTFVKSVIAHYQLPFWSIVLITIGGQAIGMRSMSIYELNADYVKYSRFLGIRDSKIVGYVFHNAMLPQITGLALSLGTMIGGALVAEIIFSYPGLGTTILAATTGQDYPLLSACTLIITIMVLIANLVVELLYGVIDPRVKAAQQD